MSDIVMTSLYCPICDDSPTEIETGWQKLDLSNGQMYVDVQGPLFCGVCGTELMELPI